MNLKELSWGNPRPEYENPSREFGYGMNEFDEIIKAYKKMAAAFGDVMNARDFEKFERKLKEYDRLLEQFDRITGTGEKHAPKLHKKYAKREEAPGNHGWWTSKTETIIISDSYLEPLKKIKDLESSIKKSYDFF
jgi:hypothetical protein